MTVRVAIDLALDRLFDYEVPEALREKLAVGQLLSVPFGHREARGFAMEIAADGDSGAPAALPGEGRGFRLKPVTAIVDETPFFSAKLIELVKKLSAYTAAPLESVLRAALPAAVLKRNMHARELLYVEPALAPAPVPGGQPADSSPAPLVTKRQQWLYTQIIRLGGGWLGQLCEELGTTPVSLRTLAEKGVVVIRPRQRRRNPLAGRGRIMPTKPKKLNAGQAAALDMISASSGVVLLWGVTGSGKTEVYLQAIAKELAAGRGAIVMVPEISLTPQTVARFASRFGDRVAVLHSALSDGERYDEWHRIRSGEARVVVGPRSAVFAPVRDLGLIVVDEEHEQSYKQDETPRYHARDAAVLRGALEGAKVVLGSATPSLETWLNVKKGRYRMAVMGERAGAGRLPAVGLVDMSAAEGAIFSKELLEAIRLRLDRHEQVILLLNRRGFSRQLTCARCGWVATCGRCDTAYTYHRADDCCRCHICGGWIETPKTCPVCGAAALAYRGIGTQRVEESLRKCFPRAGVLRMDADSTSRKNSHDDILGAFGRGEADILVGTQMIAKGLDFGNVTLVGVLNADSAINMPDLRAGERAYQLFSQVAGRAGRAELPGEVLIQTSDLASPVLKAVVKGDFASFADGELGIRRELFMPPYCHLAAVNLSSTDVKLVAAWAGMYAASLTAYAEKLSAGEGGKPRRLVVGEAVPSALEKADGRFRWQIVLRSVSASSIVAAWRWLLKARPPEKNLRIVLDLDAYNLV